MFGYVVVNKPELKIKDYDRYREYYCGLCHVLKKEQGITTQITLNNDMTFLNILLSSLYEPKDIIKKERCVMHPIHSHIARYNEYTSYCAKMTIVLTYLKCDDDVRDDNSKSRNLYKRVLQKKYDRIKKEYPKKIKTIEDNLNIITSYENKNLLDLDKVANCFGEVMSALTVYKDDQWSDELSALGFYLGKYIYLIDAYEDIESDIKKKNYNPFFEKYKSNDFDTYCKNILEMMMSEVSVNLEKLPLIRDIEILRNIVYSGVWTKYELVKKKRNQEEQ